MPKAHGCDDKSVRRCITGLDIIDLEKLGGVVSEDLKSRFRLLEGTEHYLRLSDGDLQREVSKIQF